MTKPIYLSNRHYRYFNKGRFHIEGVSRKTKKFLQKSVREGYLPRASELRWLALPNCEYCYGSGHYRDHILDTGWSCPDCRGKGKTGWKFKKHGYMVCETTGKHVEEY